MAKQLVLLAGSMLVCSLALTTGLPTDTNSPPVLSPVTGDNSGPKYDIDLGSAEPSSNLVSPNNQDKQSLLKDNKKATIDNDNNKDSTPESMPGLAIRRLWIYSDPMQTRLTPQQPWDSLMSDNRQRLQPVESGHMHPFVLLRPSPFRSIFADMFNGDETRPDDNTQDNDNNNEATNVTSTVEREEESRPDVSKADSNPDSVLRAFDPHQLMLDLLHQVLSARANQSGDFGPSPFSPNASPTTTNSTETKPEMKTESKEDVVEIDGEKYLRKTVVSKHVGDNVMFMTKKYILTPLNATVTDVTEAPKNATTTIVTNEPKNEATPPSATNESKNEDTIVEKRQQNNATQSGPQL